MLVKVGMRNNFLGNFMTCKMM